MSLSATCPGPPAPLSLPAALVLPALFSVSALPACPAQASPLCAGPVAGAGGHASSAGSSAERGHVAAAAVEPWVGWRRRRYRLLATPPFSRGHAPGACSCRPVSSRAVPPPPPCPLPVSMHGCSPVPVIPLRPCRAPAALPGSGARSLSRCLNPLLSPALALCGVRFHIPRVPFLLPLHFQESRGRCGGPLSTPELPPTLPSLPSMSAEPPPTTSLGTGHGRSCS